MKRIAAAILIAASTALVAGRRSPASSIVASDQPFEVFEKAIPDLADALKAVKDAGIDLNAKTKKSLEASFAELADPSGP